MHRSRHIYKGTAVVIVQLFLQLQSCIAGAEVHRLLDTMVDMDVSGGAEQVQSKYIHVQKWCIARWCRASTQRFSRCARCRSDAEEKVQKCRCREADVHRQAGI